MRCGDIELPQNYQTGKKLLYSHSVKLKQHWISWISPIYKYFDLNKSDFVTVVAMQ